MYLLMLMWSLAFSANATEHSPVNKAPKEQSMQKSVNQSCRECNHSNADSTKNEQEALAQTIIKKLDNLDRTLDFIFFSGVAGFAMLLGYLSTLKVVKIRLY